MSGEPPSESAAAVAQTVAARFESQQLPWFCRLVEMASHTAARDDVERAAQLVDERMSSLGMVFERVADPDGRFADHRVYRSPATGADDVAVALVGHVDTVFPRELGFLDFRHEPGEDVVRGPGVLDMKSGISAIVFGLEALAETAPELFARIRVRFVCNSDEEVGSPSSRALLSPLAPRTRAALVFEGGRDQDRIITARKGGGMFTITAHGRAAHAGLAHAQGINAIHALAMVIPRIEALTNHARGVTLNVGLIEGGTAKNTVPDRAHCIIDGRFITRADAEAVTRSLQAIVEDPFAGLEGVPEKFTDVRFELGGGVTRPPMEANAGNRALMEIYEDHARVCGLQTGEAPLQGGGSDANILAASGVPCIDGLGPFGKNFHKVEEWSSLDSLRRRTQALGMFLVDGLPLVEERVSSDHVRR